MKKMITGKASLQIVRYNRQTEKRSHVRYVVHDLFLVAENVAENIPASKHTRTYNQCVRTSKKHQRRNREARPLRPPGP